MGTRQKNLNLSHSIKILGINLSFCWGYFKFVAIKNTQLRESEKIFFRKISKCFEKINLKNYSIILTRISNKKCLNHIN